jgi:hypothetical protein
MELGKAHGNVLYRNNLAINRTLDSAMERLQRYYMDSASNLFRLHVKGLTVPKTPTRD